MRRTPPLALLAAVASLIDLLGTRLWLRVLTNRELSGLTHGALIELKRGGDFVRNLAGVAGLIALALALSEMIHPRGHGGLLQRVGIAGFAGVFLPTTFLATVLPAPRTTPVVVLFAAGAANLLVVLLTLATLRWKGALRRRMALASLAVAAFFAFTSTVLLLVARVALWSEGYPVGVALRRVGEGAWLLALLALAWLYGPWALRGVWRVVAALGGLAVAGAAFTILTAARRNLEPEPYEELLYGALHGDLFSGLPWVYAAVVAVAAGAALSGAFAPDGPARQGAAGLMLVLAAGFNPTTPVTLLMMVLGVTLLSRAAVVQSALTALGDRAREVDELRRELSDAGVPDSGDEGIGESVDA